MKTLKKTLLIIGLIILMFICWDQYSDWSYEKKYYSGLKFTPERWLANGGGRRYQGVVISGIPDRCKMYRDLSSNHLKKGMKLIELLQMLGEPDIEYYCLEKRIKCFNYRLGTCYASSWTINPGYLDICLNDRQEVIKWDRGTAQGRHVLYHEICDYKHAYRLSPGLEFKCRTKKGQLMGEKCPHPIEAW